MSLRTTDGGVVPPLVTRNLAFAVSCTTLFVSACGCSTCIGIAFGCREATAALPFTGDRLLLLDVTTAKSCILGLFAEDAARASVALELPEAACCSPAAKELILSSVTSPCLCLRAAASRLYLSTS